MNTRIVAGIVGAALLSLGLRDAKACSADVECKGDRVCQNQVCVSPAQVAPAQAVPVACRADVDCPANNLCTAGVCTAVSDAPVVPQPSAQRQAVPTPVPASAREAEQPPAAQPPAAPALESPRADPTWRSDPVPPAPAPFAPAPLVVRNPRMRDAGIALVAIGAVMEIVGIGLAATGSGNCHVEYGPSSPMCHGSLAAGNLLIVFGLPVLANGAWMWPVGGKLVPAENRPSPFNVVPYVSASGEGGSLGMKLTFF